jgi:Domain of unknown function (DUF4432)
MSYSKILVDSAHNVSIKAWKLSPDVAEDSFSQAAWSVEKRRLAGGRQEGVDIIEVDNGALKFTVVPTRGFNVWTAHAADLRLGWDSPVKEIVHPNFVELSERGGFGWLNGFGEWISRCGLESMGAPCKDGDLSLTLHGRINYLPASHVEVRFETIPTPQIILRGIVEESLMFGPQLRLEAEISTEIGTYAVTLDDTVTNLADAPQEMENLYHINFGPPLLGAGAEFIAPVKRVAPRDSRAAQADMAVWNAYTGPHEPGYTEQVYLMELFADRNSMTQAMLKSPDGKRGACLSFSLRELPFMTLWKNEAPLKTGYVTGLEPGTSYPFPRPIERAAGRLPKLGSGETYHTKVTIRALVSEKEVENSVKEITKLQQSSPEVAKAPLQAG